MTIRRLRISYVVLVALVVLSSPSQIFAQEAPILGLMAEQGEAIGELARVLKQHVGLLANARRRVPQGQHPELPDIIQDVTPPVQKLQHLAPQIEAMKFSIGGLNDAQKQQAMQHTQKLMQAGVTLQRAQDSLEQEVGNWIANIDWSPESLQNLREYSNRKRKAINGLILPALSARTDQTQELDRFATDWLNMAKQHGVSKVLEVLVKGESSDSTISQLRGELQRIAGLNSQIVSFRSPDAGTITLAIAPCVAVDALPEIEIPGERKMFRHMNVLVLDRSAIRSASRPNRATPRGLAPTNSPDVVYIDLINTAPADRPGEKWLRMIGDELVKLADPSRYGGRSFGGKPAGGYKGDIHPVRDFDRFCERANSLPFLTLIERDAGRRWVSFRVDWSSIGNSPGVANENSSSLSGNMANPIDLPSADHPDYVQQLAAMLVDGDGASKIAAGDALLKLSPKELTKEVKGEVARGFLALLRDSPASSQGVAIRGVVHYGGKHAVKHLVKVLRDSDGEVSPMMYLALAKYPHAETAGAIAARLGSETDRELVAKTLIDMGTVAEQPVIDALRTRDTKQALVAIRVLEKIGTKKSLLALGVAQDAGDESVRQAALKARASIRKRAKPER